MAAVNEGLLVVDKPSGPTSSDIVTYIRKKLRVKKAGHCGTLDPAASGVLLVVFGKATRLAEYTNDYRKRYEAVIHLGITTDTDDAEGVIIVESEPPEIGKNELSAVLSGFIGEIEQRVPAYSAVKVGGERLYKKARRGDDIDAPVRRVAIYDIEILDFALPKIWLSIECGSGTYIRSLARDIGERLGCGAHLAGLIRTGVGPYSLDTACKPGELGQLESDEPYFVPFDEMLPELPAIELDFADAEAITFGRKLKQTNEPSSTRVRLLYRGRLLAIVRVGEGVIEPEKVFLQLPDIASLKADETVTAGESR
ncbi:MAG: tRNA pseudouridine(55) synthase TruB [bacterium]|nr:tRNA pseudouridine(55) synthase TruB [bacterium]